MEQKNYINYLFHIINKTNLNFNIKQLGFKNKIFIDLNLSKCNYLNQENQENYWKDSIHYTNIGYMELANFIYNNIF